MFSTNLEPEDLMDPAFLRRLPYKIEVGSPTVAMYKQIFTQECFRANLALSEEIVDAIVHKIREEKQLPLAAYQPKFIVDQVLATCRFLGQPPHFEARFVDYAIDNLRVRRHSPAV
jgi:SpoVK/Ycf46/Vps4 family AAA+-type ATPase